MKAVHGKQGWVAQWSTPRAEEGDQEGWSQLGGGWREGKLRRAGEGALLYFLSLIFYSVFVLYCKPPCMSSFFMSSF